MTVRSIGAYDFPSRSRQELYGDDQLVHLWFQENPWFCASACFRAPKAMTWGDFWNALVVPFAEEDPDFDPEARRVFTLHGAQFEPRDDQTLEEIGVEHKDVIGMRVLV
ncbi:phenol hydroxylase [Phycicoccus sp. HDW14]|uniref:phenol hydroxylase subunit P4 n=1 Tax=Phycicoccus sp. HDW14 TaxID=2714941 RepID=UPI00140D21F0|nr:phenol hydroxylase subunit P4 [Phycicoccus sp. HDW14]QIM21860.1 phenol hydroxylase [Phycicoccus sp. HDW14]